MSETPTRTRTNAANKTSVKARANLYELEADAIKALAHPKRLLIVDLLSDGSERTVTELQDETRLSQSNVSQNLAILRAAGIVGARRDGNNVLYHLTDPRLLKAVTLLRSVMEAQLEDKRFLVERAQIHKEERKRRAVTYAVTLGIGLVGAAMLGAVGHPLLVGGGVEDVATMALYMAQSEGLGTVIDTCMSVSSTTPAGSPPVTTTL